MNICIIQHGTKEYQLSVLLRDEILRKPLKLSFDPAQLAKEDKDIHIVGFIGEKMAATLMLCHNSEDIIQMRQVAVSNDFQKQGLGKKLVIYAENYAREKGYKTMYLHARKVASGFYLALGYEIVGDEFKEVNIPHFAMQKKL